MALQPRARLSGRTARRASPARCGAGVGRRWRGAVFCRRSPGGSPQVGRGALDGGRTAGRICRLGRARLAHCPRRRDRRGCHQSRNPPRRLCGVGGWGVDWRLGGAARCPSRAAPGAGPTSAFCRCPAASPSEDKRTPLHSRRRRNDRGSDGRRRLAFGWRTTPAAAAQFASEVRSALGKCLPLSRQQAGLRPKPRGGRPLIGPLTDAPRVFVASGHYKNGVLLGPITGQIVARWIAEGTPGRDMRRFAPER